jgi:hypothetical protein
MFIRCRKEIGVFGPPVDFENIKCPNKFVDCRQTGNYPQTGLDLWEAPKLLSRMFVKVYSPCPNSELLIALHSPSAILEIGLCRYPAERSGDSDPVLS